MGMGVRFLTGFMSIGMCVMDIPMPTYCSMKGYKSEAKHTVSPLRPTLHRPIWGGGWNRDPTSNNN